MRGCLYLNHTRQKVREHMNEIITESEQIELGAADMLLVEITDRMKANGKSEIVFTDPKTKAETKFNIHMINNIIRAVYEISKGVAR